MKSSTHYLIETRYSSGWARGLWESYLVCYSLDHAIQRGNQAKKTFGDKNVRVSEVTTKRIRLKKA